MNITFRIPGVPVPKQRARKGKGGRFYTPEKTKTYEDCVAEFGQLAMLNNKYMTTGAPVRMEVVFVLPIPPSWSKTKQSAALLGRILPKAKPDIDNLIKSLLDGLRGVVFKDDTQVVMIQARKQYGATPESVVMVENVMHGISMEVAA